MVNPTRVAYASAVTPPGKRPHSIAVFGCTGNAGRAVAYHTIKSSLLQKQPATNAHDVTVALSGRNRAKVEKVLEGIRDELRSEGIKSVDDAKVDIIIADASDEQSMLELAKSTNVLISCAGPFERYGEGAVKACVEGGAHYVDITGEQAFIERMICDYGTRAEEAGVTLCPFSGYDCVPAELGMWLVSKALETQGDGDDKTKLGDLAMNIRSVGGGFPHGTIETILDSFDGKAPPRKEGTPRFFPKEYGSVSKNALSASNWLLPKYQMGQFTGPNFMSVINVPVLCRAAPAFGLNSNHLTISDKSVVSGRPTLLNGYGLIQTQIYIAGLLIGGMALAIPPFRVWLRNKISTYSYNGDRAGKVYLDVKGSSTNKKSYAVAKCKFPGDPGIYATGLFAAGVANSLLEATSVGSKFPMPIAGFHSPVVALQGCREGLLVDNLKELGAEMTVQVVSEGEGGEVVMDVDAAKLRSKL